MFGCRFVSEQHVGTHRACSRDRDALLLTTGSSSTGLSDKLPSPTCLSASGTGSISSDGATPAALNAASTFLRDGKQ